MAASDWEEIKRLAADFQRAQLSSTAHKLSERNCIEIVNKLVNLGLLDIIYTTDGKEYITTQQVEREIRDELIVHGGRINLVELQQILNIDLSHIEAKVNDIVRSDRHFTLIQGQLLDKDYLDRTAEEINETLQESGQVELADLAKTFNLPTDYLLSVIESRLGVLIHGSLDPINRDVLFTSAFIARNIAKIRGIFSAITRPVHVAQLVVQYGLPEKLFFSVLDTLVQSQRLSGSIQGHHDKAVFTPDIYTKTQMSYIESFFNQNGYIEYQTLTKLGITDGRQFMKKKFSSKHCVSLSSCIINQHLLDQIQAAIDEALHNNSYVDIMPLVPSPFTSDDTQLLLQHCLKSDTKTSQFYTFCDRVVASQQYLDDCKDIFVPLMTLQANKVMKTSPMLFGELSREEKAHLTDASSGDGKQAKKAERNKRALAGGGQKGGGGRGARESTTKKTKNKYRDRMKENEEEEDLKPLKKSSQLTFMDVEEIHEVLKNSLKECQDEEFIEEIASYICRPLNNEYQEVAKSVFVSAAGSSAITKRRSHGDYQEKVNGLWSNMRLFEKGINQFDGDTSVLLIKHLLKTIGVDIVNIIFEMVANEHLMSLSENEVFTAESRLKLLTKLPGEWKSSLTKLNTALNGKNLDDFFEVLDITVGAGFCDIMLKKVDKKRERQLLFNHRQNLLEQLEREVEPAMTLHLASVLLFQHHTGCLLHAPGRCIPHVIAYLQSYISGEDHEKLHSYQLLVMQQLLHKDDEGDLGARLSQGLPEIKMIVKNMRKS